MSSFTNCLITYAITAIIFASGDDKITADGVLSAENSLSLSITLREKHDSIELTMSGPSDVYYAIGFGSDVMVNTWTIVVDGEGDDGWFEQTLSNHKAGISRKTKSFEMLTTTLRAQSSLRRVHLYQSLSTLETYHPFNIDDDKIDIIWAIGSDKTFAKHIAHGIETLYYVNDAITDEKPHGLWVYFGDLSLSGLILLIGITCVFLVLLFYWCWKLCRYLKRRAQGEYEYLDEINEKEPLLDDMFEANSSNRYIII